MIIDLHVALSMMSRQQSRASAFYVLIFNKYVTRCMLKRVFLVFSYEDLPKQSGFSNTLEFP